MSWVVIMRSRRCRTWRSATTPSCCGSPLTNAKVRYLTMSAPALDFAVVSAAAAHADSSISRAQAKPEWIATEFSLMISLAASRHDVDAAVDEQCFARQPPRIRCCEVGAGKA